MKLLQGKVAIVTGAARGIGEAIALKFAEHGANVAFTYVSDSSAEKATALEAKLSALGVKAKAYKSNAGDYAQCEALVNDVIKEFGTVDICVNNAGISKDNLLLRMSVEQWNDVININLNSVFNMTKQVIRPMMKAKNGVIINMSSVIGEMGNAGQSSYAASKAGIIGFTKSVAKELGSRNKWLIEFEKQPKDFNGFIFELDMALKNLNSDYEAKRYKDIALRMPMIKMMKPGTFNEWLKSKGRLGGQHKVPRLSNDRNYIEEILSVNI